MSASTLLSPSLSPPPPLSLALSSLRCYLTSHVCNICLYLLHPYVRLFVRVLRQAVLEHVVDRALSEAIEAVGLYADADATSNNGSTAQQQQQQPVDKVAEFKTTYWQLAVQDSTGRLKAARIRQWAAVMEHGFGVPESEVAKAEITVEQAREITQLWAEYTDHEHFVNALDERFKRLHNYDEDPNAPAMAKAFSRSARTQALRDVLSQALMQLFKDYGYEGEKGTIG